MPGKQELVFPTPSENPNIHKNALQDQEGKKNDLRGHEQRLATADLLLKRCETSFRSVPGSVELLNRVNVNTESVTMGSDRATRFREI